MFTLYNAKGEKQSISNCEFAGFVKSVETNNNIKFEFNKHEENGFYCCVVKESKYTVMVSTQDYKSRQFNLMLDISNKYLVEE
ncbi:hypothetical protein [Flammeovirga sp. SubArs3]|uniref:hypothetical protein n=1 Tax=Flammeovirga sp. SubArs3 TaxID=2995316 RepID=UPI00248ADD91|nr:hypothetical protein [Flammeovirga sp. SubArs3]